MTPSLLRVRMKKRLIASCRTPPLPLWIPAFAGMTKFRKDRAKGRA